MPPAKKAGAPPPAAPRGRVCFGSDHAGQTLKAALAAHVAALGYAVWDVGCHGSAPSSYVTYAEKVARAVAGGAAQFGLLVCGTGLGVSMAANRVAGVRAALCTHESMAKMARAHNNANVLCLGERVVATVLAKNITEIFLATAFAGGRHQTRLQQLASLEEAP